jgi:ankyrin repeat protein
MWYLDVALEIFRWSLLALAVAWAVRRLLRRRPSDGIARCRNCRYELTGLPETTDRCPECGSHIRMYGAIVVGSGSSFRPTPRLIAGILGVLAILALAQWGSTALSNYRDEIDRRGVTLQMAIFRGDGATARTLLSLDPKLASGRNGVSMIEDAIRLDRADILIDIGKCRRLNEVRITGTRAISDADWITPLHYAAACNATRVMPILIDAGLGVNDPDSSGATPLFYAATISDPKAAVFLINRGARLDTVDDAGRTPVLVATEIHAPGVLRTLLDAGAATTGVDARGRTPLHRVLIDAREDMARLLLEHGASITARDQDGRTPFAAAAASASSNGIVSIARNWLVWVKTNRGMAAARDILAADPSIARLQGRYDSMLHDCEDLELFQALLEAGADPAISDRDGQTPLHIACARGSIERVRLLMKAGANPTVVDSQGHSPAMRTRTLDPTTRRTLERLLAGENSAAHDGAN